MWNVTGKNRKRRKQFPFFAALSCVLVMSAGCGAKKGDALGVGEVRSIVLENAGVSEQDARFVRIRLNSDGGTSCYEIEFLCSTAEYDYTVDAETGEILSMNCETGEYDLAAVPEEILPPELGQGTAESGVTPTSEAAEGQDGSGAGTQSGAQSPEDAVQNGTGQGTQHNGQAGQGTQQAEQQYIGADAAKQAALAHAGLQEDDVRFKHARLDYDDGYWKYEVEFHSGSTEYDYDIDAQTGEVLSYDHEAIHGGHGGAEPAGDMISAEEAEQIALAYADIAETEAQYLKTKLDYDDGRAEYEVEWLVGRIEYACDVDALTGEVLSFEREQD